MLLHSSINLTVSLLFFAFYSLYVLKFSAWPLNQIFRTQVDITVDIGSQHNHIFVNKYEWGYQSFGTLLKECAADSINFMPYRYETDKDLDIYLRFPTAMNMSKRFTILLYSGFIIFAFRVYFYFTQALQRTE